MLFIFNDKDSVKQLGSEWDADFLGISSPTAIEFSTISFLLFDRSSSNSPRSFNVLDEIWGELSTGFDNR